MIKFGRDGKYGQLCEVFGLDHAERSGLLQRTAAVIWLSNKRNTRKNKLGLKRVKLAAEINWYT